ncbi:MAG: DUF4982 domain-containing protein [Cyclobacteriaceae bacterium]
MKKVLSVLIVLFLFSSSTAVSQDILIGERQSFNKEWKFLKGEAEDAENPSFDDSEWRTLDLPHDWAIEGPFSVEYNARAGGLPFHGTGWYRKTFSLENTSDKHVEIAFDGAMYNAHVWINGQFLGNRPFGYMGFQYDISSYLNDGEENVIAVRLQPEDLSSRWYPGAGIYRNVWLSVNDQVHVKTWGTFVTTPEVSSSKALVNVETEIENTSESTQKVKYITTILNHGGKKVSASTKSAEIAAKSSVKKSVQLKVAKPHLWDVSDPYLYTVHTQIERNGKIVENYKSTLGIRTIEYVVGKGFFLNGKLTKMNGVCLHHDHGPLGAAVNRRATERQLEIMKSMGVNAIRTSHNPPSPEQLEFCDKLGLIVQVEAFDCWELPKVPNGYNKFFVEWHERDLRDMIRRDRNHPSVVMWSIGNEIKEQWREDGNIWAKTLADIVRDEDKSRPVSAGFNSGDPAIDNGLAQEVDIVGFNYKPLNYEKWLKENPEFIIVASETSSITSTRGAYHFPVEKYKTHPSRQVTSYDIIGPVWAYPPDIEFDALEKNPSVLGEFIWTGQDYLGEPTPYGGRDNSTNGYWNSDWPVHHSYFAPVDLVGFPKDRYYLYQSQWSEEKMIHLLPHWNWEGREEEEIPVYSYTNCDEAELFLNGKSLGKRVKGVDKTPIKIDFLRWPGGDFMSKYRLRWDVPFEAGELKVIGYVDGKVAEEKVIRTAGKPHQIKLTADRKEISADGQDISYVAVEVLDKDGNPCPWADDQIRFYVEGAGSLVAVGNGDPSNIIPFNADYQRAFFGKCMAIVKSQDGVKGEIKIKAISMDGRLKEANAVVNTK